MLAEKYSGSSGMNNFIGEIEAHAELLMNNSNLSKVIKYFYTDILKRPEEDYFKSLAIADLAYDDNNYDKRIMDLYWGLKHK